MTKLYNILVIASLTVLVGLCSYFEVFYTTDKLFTDRLYQKTSILNNNIKIIAIDEKAIAEYGPYGTWSRQIYADLNKFLNSNEDTKPAVIGYDITFVNNMDLEGDKAFADSCRLIGNVVVAENIVFEPAIISKDGRDYLDLMNVKGIEYPYDFLNESTDSGFTNTAQDKDSYIRQAIAFINYNGNPVYSFPFVIYKNYASQNNINVQMPKLDRYNRFGFRYSSKPGEFEHFSLSDVLSGKYDNAVFKDSIVLIGAYASGLQDAYNVPVKRQNQMYGIEIHANIIQALLEGKTNVNANPFYTAVGLSAAALVIFILLKRLNAVYGAAALIISIVIQNFTGIFLFRAGFNFSFISLVIFSILFYIVQLINNYMLEIFQRRKIVSAFKKYVEPKIVEQVYKKGNFEVKLGGEKRHIAVLFVDIRGFTSLAEGLNPEAVVEILNEYLALTTKAILENGGTLDKFIGDATMAVFNAPFDLDDYIFKAVKTAMDITVSADSISNRFFDKFGVNIGFGIGINCGEAVVGNIGCEFRMDYTAVGDTVNIASRLEGIAPKSKVYISSDVYEAVKDRVSADNVGAISLKGKQKDVVVYSVDSFID